MKNILANEMRAKYLIGAVLMLFFFFVSVNAVSAQSFMEKAEAEASLSDELTRILYPDAQGGCQFCSRCRSRHCSDLQSFFNSAR